MPTYRYDPATDRMVDKATGEPMLTGNEPLAIPRVFSDLPGYASPIDGRWIEGRRARKYDLERSGCVDASDFSPAGGRKLKNRKFAEKRGLTHLLEQ